MSGNINDLKPGPRAKRDFTSRDHAGLFKLWILFHLRFLDSEMETSPSHTIFISTGNLP
jgi:hypothetical protein